MTSGLASVCPPAGLLEGLGVIGLDALEPVVLGALVSREPLLLIGAHGTGKSYLLTRLAEALGLPFRHYNASLLSFDDLAGFPLPNGRGGLDYVHTPATIWGAGAVFFDEISRCRPDMQNKLFPIVHERRVQGILLDQLVYRWSAMNPPDTGDDDDLTYHGSEPLDPALADRFAFVVTVPDWHGFSQADQERVILAGNTPIDPAAAARLRAVVAAGAELLPRLHEHYGPRLAGYVRVLSRLLAEAGLHLSARRAGMLLRNVLAVHAARHALAADAALVDSAFLALGASLPQPALGEPVKPLAVHAAHREAWRQAALDEDSPLRLLLAEPDPLRRALRAAQLPSLSRADFSGVVADALAALDPGARHALAVALFEQGAAGRLVAAVAEQCAELYALVATQQDVRETVAAGSPRHQLWQRVVATLAQLDPAEPENLMASNLVTGLFARGEIAVSTDVERLLDAWQAAWPRLREAA